MTIDDARGYLREHWRGRRIEALGDHRESVGRTNDMHVAIARAGRHVEINRRRQLWRSSCVRGSVRLSPR